MTVSNVNKKISFLNTLAKAGIKKHLLIDSSGWDEIREVDEHEQIYFNLNPEGIKIGYENEWLAHLMGLLKISKGHGIVLCSYCSEGCSSMQP